MIDGGMILEAAIGCVEEDGVGGFGVNAVARRLGIKPPSLYNHVKNGDELALLVVVEGNWRMLRFMESRVKGVEGGEALGVLMCAMREWAHEHEALYMLMSQHSPDPASVEFKPVLELMFALFSEALLACGVKESEHVHALRMLRSMMHGFILLEAGSQFALAEDVTESFEWMIARFKT